MRGRFQIENCAVKFHQLVLVMLLFFSSCWHEQWEDRLASGDTGIVTHGPRSTPADTSKHSNRYYYGGCVPSSHYYAGNGHDGRALFRSKCASCHNASTKNSTGPGLMYVLERVPSKQWIYAFIRNSDSVIKSGDAYANRIFKENSGSKQPTFSNLTDEEINAILEYCNPGCQ